STAAQNRSLRPWPRPQKAARQGAPGSLSATAMRPLSRATAHRCRQCAPDRRDPPSGAGTAASCRMLPAASEPAAEDRSNAGKLRKREPAQRSANTSIARSSLLPSDRQGLLLPSSSVRPDDPMLAFWPAEGPPKNIAKNDTC